MTNLDTTATAKKPKAAKLELSALEVLQASYAKNGRVVLFAGEDETAFMEFTDLFDGSEPAKKIEDWSPQTPYAAPRTLSLVYAANQENRFVMFPGEEEALKDPVIRKRAYEWYISRGVRAAEKDDATKVQFASPSGFFTGFDLGAWKFQSGLWVKYFQDKGLKSIAVKSLRQALTSRPYAESQFPRVPQSLWERVLGAMAEKAQKAGYDPSLLAHWLATREVQEIDVTELDATDDELAKVGAAEAAPIPASPPADGASA